MRPRISVLMPVYNVEKYIGKAIESTLDQTFTDFELIIIDDCSNDGTVRIIQAFDDPRINLIRKSENTGYVDSLNMGLALAKGKYIARMDGDDISLPHRFSTQVNILDANEQLGLCCSNYQVISERGILDSNKNWPATELPVLWQLLWENPIAHPSVMMRTEIIRKHGFVYEKTKHPAEDYDLWCRMAVHTKFHRTDDVLIYYRVHAASEFQKNKEAAFKNGLDSLNTLGCFLMGNRFPVMHIQHTIFRNLVLEYEPVEPGKYHNWLKTMMRVLLEKNYIQSRDVKIILEDIQKKVQNVRREYWINRREFSLKTMLEFYSFRNNFFTFGIPFQARFIGKCLIGYTVSKNSKTIKKGKHAANINFDN